MAEESSSPQPSSEDLALRSRNARYGLGLFVAYVALYAAFIAINISDPLGMARPVLAGVNLAIVFGLVLILVAFSLALVYMALCRRPITGKDAP